MVDFSHSQAIYIIVRREFNTIWTFNTVGEKHLTYYFFSLLSSGMNLD